MEKEKILITIDGLASSGKSTVARMLSKTLNLPLLESGKLYRMVTFWLLNGFQKQKNFVEEIERLFEEVRIELTTEQTLIYWQDRNLTKELRTKEIDEKVSEVSAIKEIRDFLTSLMRKLAYRKNLVAEGRDMGSVVFPWAKFKIFLVAHSEIRAKRRYEELILNNQEKRSYEEILQNLKKRDELDTQRKFSPLTIPKGAYIIDTSYLSLEEVLKKILKFIKSDEE